MLAQCKPVEFVDGRQSTSLGARGLPLRIKESHVILDILFGDGVWFGDITRFQPNNVFGDI